MKNSTVRPDKNLFTHQLSVPLDGVTAASFDIHAGSGNLQIDRLATGEQLLASGELEYRQNQSLPTSSLVSSGGQATLTLQGSAHRQSWLHLPWETCNGATEWRIHLNPTLSSNITAHSGGGNIKLDLSGMLVTHLSAGTGGGNIEVVLPANPAGLVVDAKSGAGNVTIQVPEGLAAKILAKTGLGKVTIDPRFTKVADNTYLSSGYDAAAYQVEITAMTGAGNVIVCA